MKIVLSTVLGAALFAALSSTLASAEPTGNSAAPTILAQLGRTPRGCEYRQVCVRWTRQPGRPPIAGAIIGGAILGGGQRRVCAQWRNQLVCMQ